MRPLPPVALLCAASVLSLAAGGHGGGHNAKKSGSAAGGGARVAKITGNGGNPRGEGGPLDNPLPIFTPFPVGIASARKMDNVDRSHNWCQLVADVSSGRVPFKDALRGKTVSIVFPDQGGPLSVRYNRSTGMVEGGLTVEVFEEISRRAGFHWHQQMAVVDFIDRAKGETDFRFLQWAVRQFDVSDWFVVTPRRARNGVTFSFPFIDMSPHLVTKVTQADKPLYDTVLSIFKPFRASLWIVVGIFFLFSAAVYVMLEKGSDDIQQKTCSGGIAQSLFLTIGSFTGGGGFAPATPFGKLFVLSWTFLVLLLISAYTANLASEMVVTASTYSPVQGILDAAARSVRVCARRGSIYQHLLQEHFPSIPLHLVDSEEHKFDALREHKCVAGVVSQMEWDFEQGLARFNGGCHLDAVGRNFMDLDGSFAAEAADAGRCKEIVIQIMSFIMHEMYLEGYFKRIYEKYKSESQDLVCASAGQRKDTEHMGPKDMAGAFAIHLIMSVICLVGAGVLTKGPPKADEDHDTDNSDESSGNEEVNFLKR